MDLLTVAHPGEPALDMAVSHALLRRVAAGELPETARIYRPGPTLAFGRLDAHGPGYAAARTAAVALGWSPVLRLGGGRAAAYDQGSVVLELVTRTATVTEGLQERFAAGVGLLVTALERVGVDAEIGELPGEYCPGRWSVHLRDGPKVAGAAQRAVRGATLFTAVVVVEGGARVAEAIAAVYDALALPWDPATAGAAQDGRPGLSSAAVAAALRDELRHRRGPVDATVLDDATRAAARELLPLHAG